ncbi:MAG: GHKL domain-containing protein [Pseudobutyrivibrio sp.]|nr:GHKL domain-containing protein [Pseudobutyrivibrio sp.]
MVPFSTYVFEEMRLPIELMAATLIFTIPFAQKKSNFLARVITGFVAMTALALMYFVIFGTNKELPRFPYASGLWYLFLALLAPLFIRFCFYISEADATLFGGLSFATQNIVYNLYHIYLAKIRFPHLRTNLLLYILGAIVFTAIIYTIIYRTYVGILEYSEGSILINNRKNVFTYTLINIIIYVLLIFYQSILMQATSYFDRMAWLSGIAVSILIILVDYNNITALVYSSKTKIMENMIRNNEHYYELSKAHIAIINRKCHDLKHQLKILRTVSEDERNEYIDEAEKSIIFYQDLIYTNNEALNTILAEKGLFCRENNIDFHCSVDDVDLSFIRVSDLYALLGNAIDNAIEYTKCQTDEKLRSISLRISKKMNFVGIQISNPLTEEDSIRIQQNKSLSSTKGNKDFHGFGIKSIKYLTEKYNGTMEYSASDGVFTMQILFLFN